MTGNIQEKAIHEFRFDLDELLITKDRVARMMGYSAEIPPPVEDVLSRCFDLLPRHVTPRGGFLVSGNVRFQEDSFCCEEVTFQPGRLINNILRESTLLAFFTVTVGPGLDAWSRLAFEESDMLMQYVIDTTGSEIAEALADRIMERIAATAGEAGLSVTNRYSPGYCGWQVSEQKKLFSLFSGQFCGITLTESSLMLPIKSVSGVIGIGKSAVKKEYQCSLCDLPHCFRRRVKEGLSRNAG